MKNIKEFAQYISSQYIGEARKKHISNVPESKEFSDEELNVAIDKINNILTVFKDEGIQCLVDPSRFRSGELCVGIYIELKINSYIYSDREVGTVWDNSVREKFKKVIAQMNFLNDEIDNLFTNLEEFFVLDNFELNGQSFTIVVSNK